jgi:hypothetical protein
MLSGRRISCQQLLCRRYNYQKIQTAMAEKAAAAAASADIERQPMLQMSANGLSSPDKAKGQSR